MRSEYDIVTIGGGLAGAALAHAMARNGARVLVLEREEKFKDRVRGEGMSTWGTAEARELGLYDFLLSVGNELHWWDFYFGSQRAFHRNLPDTTPQGCAMLTFFHPDMQEVLLQAACDAGAKVQRNALVRSVVPGAPARVVYEEGGTTNEATCRLAVGADGRRSLVRRWAGFEVQREPEFLFVTGVLLDDVDVDDQTLRMDMNLATGIMSFMNPQGNGRVRAYLVSRKDARLRLDGDAVAPRFIHESVKTGVPHEVLDRARAAGPIATFAGADTWVDHPCCEGVALIGDAAAASDPSWGQGLSLTLRDVRVLRDMLISNDDWQRASHAYAEDHDRYYRVCHTVNNWLSDLFYTPGVEADAVRARALPLLAQDPTRIPDTNFSGPDIELNDFSRSRLFAED